MLQLHNNHTSFHMGREKTMRSIKGKIYWPGMSDDQQRRMCQAFKPCTKNKT